MTTKSAQIMVVAPHPDDAEFGAAGTIARWARAGADIVYLICTNGDKGTSDPKMSPLKLAKIREKEQRAAAKPQPRASATAWPKPSTTSN